MAFGSKLGWRSKGSLIKRFYRRLFGYPLQVDFRIRMRNTLSAFVFQSKDVILDAGCGDGHACLHLAPGVKTVFGLDCSKEGISRATEAARGLGLENVNFQVGDLTALPYKERTFDKIFSVDVLEHIEDDVTALKELWRVLKDGGLLAIHTPAPGGPFVLKSLKFDGSEWGHVRDGYTIENLGVLLKNAGFTILKEKDTFRFFQHFALEIGLKYGTKWYSFPFVYAISFLDFISKRKGNGVLIIVKKEIR